MNTTRSLIRNNESHLETRLEMKSNVENSGPTRWPRGLRRGSAAAHLLGLTVRIPPVALMYVSCECCALSGRGRGLCYGPIPLPEVFYLMCLYHWVWWTQSNSLHLTWVGTRSHTTKERKKKERKERKKKERKERRKERKRKKEIYGNVQPCRQSFIGNRRYVINNK